jgi:vacuolar-type H+-ATPase subunit C/Vma6
LNTGERAFVYAKACGIIGKSFLGKGLSVLQSIHQLADLDRLIFPGTTHEVPDKQLLRDLEYRITTRAVTQILTIMDAFAKTPELLVQMVRSYECADLKTALSAYTYGENSIPHCINIGRFRTIAFEAYPDLPKMLAGSAFEFLLQDALITHKKDNTIDVQTIIDHRYYEDLWRLLMALSKSDRRTIEIILREEIVLHNVVWAIRLRTYYRMNPEEIRTKFIAIKNDRSFDQDAINSLEFSLKNYADWADWKYKHFLNPERPDRQWEADPRYIQNVIAAYLYQQVRRLFHGRPFSLDTAFCFIKLKQYEEDILTSMSEGLSLSLSSTDIFSLLEVPV